MDLKTYCRIKEVMDKGEEAGEVGFIGSILKRLLSLVETLFPKIL